jgi:hypothetical protein
VDFGGIAPGYWPENDVPHVGSAYLYAAAMVAFRTDESPLAGQAAGECVRARIDLIAATLRLRGRP